MSSKILGRCPVCGANTAVTRLKCTHCSTEIQGDFSPCDFCRLAPEQARLITIFLQTRGNFREVERELGISYPTIRSRLEEALDCLGIGRQKGGDEKVQDRAGGAAAGAPGG